MPALRRLAPFAFALLLAACGGPVNGSAPPAPAPAVSDWVEETLAGLTLREKVGQLVMPWVGGEYVAEDSPGFDRLRRWVEEDRVGGVIVSVGLPHSIAAKLNRMQALAELPLLVTSDMENGPGMRLAGIYSIPHLLPQGGGTVFPPIMSIGATGSEEHAYELGRITGVEARAVGIHMTFGPVLDVNANPVNPIINTRSFGEDPSEVARLGRAYVRGARSAGLLTTGKHFPGHGDTEVDSHIDLPRISADRARLDAVDLPPFRAAIEEGIDGIMTAHIAVTGVEGDDAPPATLSPYFMTEVLRREMGFDGLLFTDAMTMGGIARHYDAREALVLALEAGADVLLMPRDVTEAIDAVTAAVEAGRISEARIDASVRRLLRAKERVGLPGQRMVDLEAVDRVVGTLAHAEAARGISEESLTLVRDRGDLMPLAPETRRVLSVTFARPSDLVAGRAFDQALEARGEVERVRVDVRTTPEEWADVRARAEAADRVVVSAYVAPVEYDGSVGVGAEMAAFVSDLTAAGRDPVVISFGSPYLLHFFPEVSTYLLAWGRGDASQRAAAAALRGEIPIRGTLPISLPPEHQRGTGVQRPTTAAAGR
jgi:beta-N-acetylhexosaminidase